MNCVKLSFVSYDRRSETFAQSANCCNGDGVLVVMVGGNIVPHE